MKEHATMSSTMVCAINDGFFNHPDLKKLDSSEVSKFVQYMCEDSVPNWYDMSDNQQRIYIKGLMDDLDDRLLFVSCDKDGNEVFETDEDLSKWIVPSYKWTVKDGCLTAIMSWNFKV